MSEVANTSIGHGNILKRSPDGGATYVEIGQVKTMPIPKKSKDMVDATHFGSPGGWREYVPGLKTLEPVDVEIQYSALSDLADLNGDFASDDLGFYAFEFADDPGNDVPFNAYVSSIDFGNPLDATKIATVTFTPSGGPTY